MSTVIRQQWRQRIAQTGETRTLWRGLFLGAVPEEEVNEAKRNPAAYVRKNLQNQAGIHWTDDPTSAWNFAMDRDPEGWAHESYGDDDEEPMWAIGIIIECEVGTEHIVDPDSEEGEGYAFSDAILDYGTEREVTVRDGAPITITDASIVYASPDGEPEEVHAPMRMQTRAAADAEFLARLTYEEDSDSADQVRKLTAKLDGTEVGYIQVYGRYYSAKARGRIKMVQVWAAYQRKGVATALFEEAQRRWTDLKIGHSEDRTNDGDAWARSIGGPLPRRTRA